MRTHTSFIFLIIAAISIMGCKGRMEISGKLEGQPEIFPDYRGVTVPDNIAPLDFDYSGNLTSRLIVNGKMLKPKKGGRFIFSKRQWKKMDEGKYPRNDCRYQGEWYLESI